MRKKDSPLLYEEEVLISRKAHFITLVPRIIITLITISLYKDTAPIIILIAGILLVSKIITYLTTYMAVTNIRILGHTGFIKSYGIESAIRHVNNCSVYQTLMGRIFDYGTISVLTSNGVSTSIPYIKNPYLIKKYVFVAIDEAELRNIQRQAEANAYEQSQTVNYAQAQLNAELMAAAIEKTQHDKNS